MNICSHDDHFPGYEDVLDAIKAVRTGTPLSTKQKRTIRHAKRWFAYCPAPRESLLQHIWDAFDGAYTEIFAMSTLESWDADFLVYLEKIGAILSDHVQNQNETAGLPMPNTAPARAIWYLHADSGEIYFPTQSVLENCSRRLDKGALGISMVSTVRRVESLRMAQTLSLRLPNGWHCQSS